MMTIAGSDCSAGAGLQADLKAAHAMGAFALTAVTCVVSEAPGTVRGMQEVDPALVADQVRINLEHFPVALGGGRKDEPYGWSQDTLEIVSLSTCPNKHF